MNKYEILAVLKRKVDEKIAHLQQLIDETRASNNDTKSSMGDKYETGREMLQQEINNLQSQLKVVVDQKNELEKLTNEPRTKVEKGALVQTTNGWFYISVSYGEILLDGKKIFAISPESPLAKAMWNKSKNEIFILNGKQQSVTTVL